MKNTKKSWLAILSASLFGCGGGGGGPFSGVPAALVVTTDYQSGALSLVEKELAGVQKNIAVIHSDAVCRYDSVTKRPYVVSRYGADAVEVLDPKTFAVSKEYSTGSGSNPQDILPVSAERAYVSLYAENKLKVVHPTEGTELGTVDLAGWADRDGVPEAAWMEKVGERVFVALQRLENFAPSDRSSLLVLAAGTGKVEKEIALAATNPFGKIRYSKVLGKLVVAEMGFSGVQDGGVELVDPIALQPEGICVSEGQLGGDVLDAVILDQTRGWAVVSIPKTQGGWEAKTQVVSFNPSTKSKTGTLLESEDFVHSLLELSPDGSQLWVTDRTLTAPGIRVFSTADGTELTQAPLDVGLPPFMVCFLD